MSVTLTPFVEGNKIVDAIYDAYVRNAEDWRRDHLGASVLGNKCERALWYGFRWATCPDTASDGRMLRLFDTGTKEEARLCADLRAIGCIVHDLDPATGKQFRHSDVGGHVGGSMDAAVYNVPGAEKTWHVGEFKTHNAKSWADLSKNGVEVSKPLHYVQSTLYMGWSTMDRAIYLGRNKDTDHLHAERIKFDASLHERTIGKAIRIVQATAPLARLSERADWYECKMCDHYPVCHGGQAAVVSCRSCVHSTPITNGNPGEWRCAHYDNAAIPSQAQRAGCQEHLFIPDLVPFATPLEAGDGWVVYKHKTTGRTFVNVAATAMPPITEAFLARFGNDGRAPGMYASVEIARAADTRLIGSAEADELKAKFGAGTEIAA